MIRYTIISLVLAILIEGMVFGVIHIGIFVLGNRPERTSYTEAESLLPNNTVLSSTPTPTMVEETNEGHGNNGSVVWVVLICLISGTMIFLCFFLTFLRRYFHYVDELTEGIVRITHGDFETKIPVRYKDELSAMANTINILSVSIQKMITQQKENEQSKNDLITSVAHDLRTPLTSIIGYLDLVKSGKVTNNETKLEYTKIAYEKAKRLQNLIEDLFTYTQVSFGKITMRGSELDMVKFLEQIAEEFYPIFQEANLEYSFDTQVKKALIFGDGDLLARTFANLYGNAVKYGSAGEKVEVKLEEEEDTYVVKITNYGQLIPEKDIDRIFERFYRVDNSRSGETGGTGLGLAIAKNIVMMHGGSIAVTSTINGTTFSVALLKKKMMWKDKDE